jgi:hypothetical protein
MTERRTFTFGELVATRGEPYLTGKTMKPGTGSFASGAGPQDVTIEQTGEAWVLWNCMGVLGELRSAFAVLEESLAEQAPPARERLLALIASLQKIIYGCSCVALQVSDDRNGERYEVVNACVRHGDQPS